MAVYEYECKKCGSKIEVRENINGKDQKPLLQCPKCGILSREKFEKLMSKSTFKLNFKPFH